MRLPRRRNRRCQAACAARGGLVPDRWALPLPGAGLPVILGSGRADHRACARADPGCGEPAADESGQGALRGPRAGVWHFRGPRSDDRHAWRPAGAADDCAAPGGPAGGLAARRSPCGCADDAWHCARAGPGRLPGRPAASAVKRPHGRLSHCGGAAAHRPAHRLHRAQQRPPRGGGPPPRRGAGRREKSARTDRREHPRLHFSW